MVRRDGLTNHYDAAGHDSEPHNIHHFFAVLQPKFIGLSWAPDPL
jgi:hypothetical protein